MGERWPDFDAFIKAKPVRSNIIAMPNQRNEPDDKMKVCIPDEKARLINGRNKVDLKPEDLEFCDKDATKLLEDYFWK